MLGANDIYALGDASVTRFAPTAQVASRQGAYLAEYLNELAVDPLTKPAPFSYTHLGTLAYVGKELAIADLPGKLQV